MNSSKGETAAGFDKSSLRRLNVNKFWKLKQEFTLPNTEFG